MPIYDKQRVFLTDYERSLLQNAATKNDITLGPIKTRNDYIGALLCGLSPERTQDMLAFFENAEKELPSDSKPGE